MRRARTYSKVRRNDIEKARRDIERARNDIEKAHSDAKRSVLAVSYGTMALDVNHDRIARYGKNAASASAIYDQKRAF